MKTKTLARLVILTIILVIGLSVITAQTSSVQAVGAEVEIKANLETVKTAAGLPGEAAVGSDNIIKTIGEVIKVFLGFLAIIFIILVIYAGFLWMTSAGDDAKVTKAKGLITNAIIGIIIILAAYILTSFVIGAVLDSTIVTSTSK
jgi:hypothetical protein